MSEYELADKYFPAEDSSVPELPPEEPYSQEWQEWEDAEWEPEAEEQTLDPGDYPELDRSALSPEGNAYADQVMLEAAQAAREQDYQGGLYVRVEEVAKEFGLRGEPLQAVAQEVDQALKAQFYAWLGQGYDPGQAAAALQDCDIDGEIRAGLQWQLHLKSRANSSLGPWFAGREADARMDELMGRPPKPDIMNSPAIQKLGRDLAASEERQRAWREGVMESYKRQTGQ